MKKARTMMLLALTALAAVAMAAPVTASAAQWTKEGKPLTQEASIQLDGKLTWRTLGTNYLSCPFEGEATLYPGDEGEITSFNIVQAEESPPLCIGTGGFAGCVVEGFQAESIPWDLQAYVSGKDYGVIMEHDVNFAFEPGTCVNGGTFFKIKGPVWLKSDNPLAVSKFSIPTQQVPGYATLIEGNLDVTPAGVYGIE